MKGPVVRGTIERRIVSCYACEPALAAGLLPAGLQPLEQAGRAVASIVLDWWTDVRPGFLPPFLAGSPARVLHGIVVETTSGEPRTGTFTLRADTSSAAGSWLDGGRLRHCERRARIALEIDAGRLSATATSRDGRVRVGLRGHRAAVLADSVLFESAEVFARYYERIQRRCRTGAGRLEFGPPDPVALHWEPIAVESELATLFAEGFPDRVAFDSAFLGGRLAFDTREERSRESVALPIGPTLQPAP